MGKHLLPLISVALVLLCLSVAVTGVLGPVPPTITAKAGSTPTIDGVISPGEWDDAMGNGTVSFNKTTVYAMQDSVNLYVAFNVSDSTYSAGDECHIYLDVEHNDGSSLQSDDRALIVKRTGGLVEMKGPGTTWQWVFPPYSGWTANVNSTSTFWQVEYNITYTKIGVIAGTAKTIGVELESFDYRELPSPSLRYMWPYSTDPNFDTKPNQWGDMWGENNWIPEFSNPWILAIVFTAALPILLYFRARKKLYK